MAKGGGRGSAFARTPYAMNALPRAWKDSRVDLAVSLALDAGRRAVAALGRVPSEWKRPGERLTTVDTEIQARLLREIRTWFPDDGVIAEEAGRRVGVEREFVWALDPLDGTNNFDAAWNVCVRAPVAPALRPIVDGWLARHKLRVFGSVALHLAYAALGAIDLVRDDRAAVWDLTAGAAILLEAGGHLTALDGGPLFPLDLARDHDAPVPFVAGNAGAHRHALLALSPGSAGVR
jgi:fructose-1,6-bisphosphatase/inositol monophosphatase family enzyme